MTVADDHIVHHKHVCQLYKELLADVEGIALYENPSSRYDSNYWLCTILLDPSLHVKGEEHAYETAVQGAVGGAAGVTHAAASLHTGSEPNRNVEALRMALDTAGIESRPLWKPMHLQPVYVKNPAYVNGVSESLFKCGLCLPSGPYVTDEDVVYIVRRIKANILECRCSFCLLSLVHGVNFIPLTDKNEPQPGKVAALLLVSCGLLSVDDGM